MGFILDHKVTTRIFREGNSKAELGKSAVLCWSGEMAKVVCLLEWGCLDWKEPSTPSLIILSGLGKAHDKRHTGVTTYLVGDTTCRTANGGSLHEAKGSLHSNGQSHRARGSLFLLGGSPRPPDSVNISLLALVTEDLTGSQEAHAWGLKRWL